MSKIQVIAAETHTPEYLLHKYWARKPHNVLSHFIKTLVPQDGIVVDPFCGSGVVLHEAQKLGRRAYGFDINPTACLITEVLINPPKAEEFVDEVTFILDKIAPAVDRVYSENGKPIKFCVHEIVARCHDCNHVQKQVEATRKGKALYCCKCGVKLRVNLEHLVDTDISAIVYEGSKELENDLNLLQMQKAKSAESVFAVDTTPFVHRFSENRRILAYDGMTTESLFTKRNFSILCYLSNAFSEIKNEQVRKAALLLLSASVAQCSRLIANRNNLSTGGPAWSVPGFWVPAVHLETNPLVHLRARLQKFARGLKVLNDEAAQGAEVKQIDSRVGLAELSEKGVLSDLVFFDPPYGDNVPYLEFSSMWNSFLKDFPNPDCDISVSDRKSKEAAWTQYKKDLNSSISAIRNNLKSSGSLLITFNNNDMRAWEALLTALQENMMYCDFVTYQIPAVVSSKAQMSIEGSYISDIYSIYKKGDGTQYTTSLSTVYDELINCARYRGGRISKSLAQRTMILAWLKNNISVTQLHEMVEIQKSLFDEIDGLLVLKKQPATITCKFENDAKKIAADMLKKGPCEWRALYETVAVAVADYGIPDPHELRAILESAVVFNGNRCMAFLKDPDQLTFF